MPPILTGNTPVVNRCSTFNFCNHLDIQCPSGGILPFFLKISYSGSMSKEEIILRFEEVSFDYGHNHPILNEADFSAQGDEGCFDGTERRRQKHYLSTCHGRIGNLIRAR